MTKESLGNMMLRDVQADDLPIFFVQQLDPDANYMAAFTREDPADRVAFDAHWDRILGDESVIIQSVVWDEQVVGSVLSFVNEGKLEISYWIGKDFWGRGIATRAVQLFLAKYVKRPIYGRAASDNFRSIRVLEKCGFKLVDRLRGYANSRQEEINEVVLELT